jgi:hypothetical protein
VPNLEPRELIDVGRFEGFVVDGVVYEAISFSLAFKRSKSLLDKLVEGAFDIIFKY